ncbi:molecular chaperone TorD family protein [Vannielia sp.]|uniref:TorD/DmsD family molecular chaperone n=1 Tax=Vannielia sp. TaxID=2813045 RepID=UPI0026266EF5|nr:molecular chaperone TorD family protein [Vannielia sp.]MDF1872849.1 molecular chaperone TorD family protein [Vannielia sp.]
MTDTHMIPRVVAYRWLAQFFLCPPDLAKLESYNSVEGRQFLTSLQYDPVLASPASWLKDAVANADTLAHLQARISSAFTGAFDMGGPRAALPYASVYLSDNGLLFQKPARDMIALLQEMEMQLPEGVSEPADHLGVQLQVAAELLEREEQGEPVPIPAVAFLDQQVLTWLPAFHQRCATLAEDNPIRIFADAAQALVQDTVHPAELCREPV